MASIAATERLINGSPDIAAAAVRAIVATQTALKEDVTHAQSVGQKLFPASEAALIVDLIRRDLPYYDAAIPQGFVSGMNTFARQIGILKGETPYESVVATQFSPLWQAR